MPTQYDLDRFQPAPGGFSLVLEFLDINPALERILDSAWAEKTEADGSVSLTIRRSPWRRWRPPCLTGKTTFILRI